MPFCLFVIVVANSNLTLINMHTANTICVYCDQPTNDGKQDELTCYGFCGKSFHLACLATENPNYNKPLEIYLKKVENLHWYCHTCTTFSTKGIAAALIESVKLLCDIKQTIQPQLDMIKSFNAAYQAKTSNATQTPSDVSLTNETPSLFGSNVSATSGESTAPSQHSSSTSISNEQHKIQIDGDSHDKSSVSIMLIDDQTPKTSPKSIPHDLSQRVFKLVKRRLSPESPSGHTARPQKQRKTTKSNDWKVTKSSATNKKSISSTKSVTSTSNSNQNSTGNFVRAPKSSLDETKMVYVSRFSPDVTTDEIMAHLKKNKSLNVVIDKIEIIKLLKKDVSIDNLTFVSFGIKVPKRYVTFLTHPSVWPEGITATDFVEKPSANFNRDLRKLVAVGPSKTQHAKIGQTSVNEISRPKNRKSQPIKSRKRPQHEPQAQHHCAGPSPPTVSPLEMMTQWLSMFGHYNQPCTASK